MPVQCASADMCDVAGKLATCQWPAGLRGRQATSDTHLGMHGRSSAVRASAKAAPSAQRSMHGAGKSSHGRHGRIEHVPLASRDAQRLPSVQMGANRCCTRYTHPLCCVRCHRASAQALARNCAQPLTPLITGTAGNGRLQRQHARTAFAGAYRSLSSWRRCRKRGLLHLKSFQRCSSPRQRPRAGQSARCSEPAMLSRNQHALAARPPSVSPARPGMQMRAHGARQCAAAAIRARWQCEARCVS